jgi:hypothetical protein
VVGDGGGSSKSFDPTDGVEVSSLDFSSNGASGMVVEGLPSIAGGVLVSAAGGAQSLMDISSIAPSLSTRKLNSPKAISKPPVLAEVGHVRPEMGPMTHVAARSMTSPEAVVGSMPSMLTVDEAPSMMVSMTDGVLSMMMSLAVSMVDDALSMAVSMADGALSMAVSMADGALSMAVSMAVLMAMVGEGAGESVDPDPVVPTVGAN